MPTWLILALIYLAITVVAFFRLGRRLEPLDDRALLIVVLMALGWPFAWLWL